MTLENIIENKKLNKELIEELYSDWCWFDWCERDFIQYVIHEEDIIECDIYEYLTSREICEYKEEFKKVKNNAVIFEALFNEKEIGILSEELGTI